MFPEPVKDGIGLNIKYCNCWDDDPKGVAADSAVEAIFGVVNREEASGEVVDELFWDVDSDVKYLVKVFATLYGPTLYYN